jgi:two-component system, OmpR family, sensor kinase
MTAPADARLLRRATFAVAAQVAAAVAVAVVLVSALAFSLTIRAEHAAEERTVRTVTLAADADLTGTDGVVLLRRTADGSIHASPGTPVAVLQLDPARLRPGRGNAEAGGRHFEVYVVNGPGGTRTAGLLDVTAREESGERLILSVAIAGVLGIVAGALLGALLGRRAVRPLAHALAMQRRFVADASHELRTPLTVLHTRAELIRRRLARASGPVDERMSAEITQLAVDTKALGEVVEDLLLSAELQDQPSRGAPIDAGDLVTELVASLAAHAGTLQVALDADVGSGDLTVTGVRSSLRRALAALVDNALAHVSAGGAVTVAARRDGKHVRLIVADDGEGLDPADAARLLERFARGEQRREQPGRRFGLGLALVSDVVHAHGGRLDIDGRPGAGATFTIALPAAGRLEARPATVDPPTTAAPPVMRSGGASG